MKTFRALRNICSFFLIFFTSVAFCVPDASTDEKVDSRSVNLQKAEQLGVDHQTYRKLALVSQGYNSFSDFEGTTDISKHSAAVQYSILLDNDLAIPDVLQTELNDLVSTNFAIVANELNVTEERLNELLVGFIRLNSQAILQTNGKPVDSRVLTYPPSRSTEDNEPLIEDISVVYVAPELLNGVIFHGHAGMFNRFRRDATARWGIGAGTLVAVFYTGNVTIVREYTYDAGQFFPSSQDICYGECVVTYDISL